MSTVYVAGYDGSPAAAAAVQFASKLAAAGDASLTVAAVAPYDPRPQRGNNPAYSAAVEDEAKGLLARAAAASGRDDFETRMIAARSPAGGLHELAEETEAALIAVGATEHGRLTSVPERLLNGAPCPVVVVPESAGDGSIRVIAVAFDGGVEAFAAAREAERLALACGAALRIISVNEPVAVGAAVPMAYEMNQSIHEWLESQTKRLLDELSPDVRAETKMAKGDAARVVADECRAGVDLVVSGSRGYGPIAAVLMGSFSHKLVRLAPCPVMLVPRGWQAETQAADAANVAATTTS